MRTTFALASLYCLGSIGCVPHPITHSIRVRAHIPEIDKRVISIQMISPMGSGSELVISYGVFTAALLEASDDALRDFFAGHATPAAVSNGDIQLHVTESGTTRMLRLPPRETCLLDLRAFLEVPPDIEDAKVNWDERAETEQRQDSSLQ